MIVPAPIAQFWPITDEFIWAFSETVVEDPIRVLVPILHVLGNV